MRKEQRVIIFESVERFEIHLIGKMNNKSIVGEACKEVTNCGTINDGTV